MVRFWPFINPSQRAHRQGRLQEWNYFTNIWKVAKGTNVSMNGLVKSCDRVFKILELFLLTRRPMRLKEMVDGLGFPTSSIAALLKSMTAQGYLHYDAAARTYMPTPRLAQLVSWLPAANFEQGIVLDAMRYLQAETNELIVLGAENGIYLEYVETLRSTEGMQLYITPGTRRLLVQIGGGWLILSRRPVAEALETYRQTIAMGEFEEYEFTPQQFIGRMDEYRNLEVSFLRAREVIRPVAHWGGGMVTMLLPIPPGHRCLTIGVGGPADRLEAHLPHIEKCLRTAVSRIQAALDKEAAT